MANGSSGFVRTWGVCSICRILFPIHNRLDSQNSPNRADPRNINTQTRLTCVSLCSVLAVGYVIDLSRSHHVPYLSPCRKSSRSDWSLNTFIMVVYGKKFSVVLRTENSDRTQKTFFYRKHCKTISSPFKTDCSICRVFSSGYDICVTYSKLA